jgi:hypothetical protein
VHATESAPQLDTEGQRTRRANNVRDPARLHQRLVNRALPPTALRDERVNLRRYLPDRFPIHPSVLPEESGFHVAYYHEGGAREDI